MSWFDATGLANIAKSALKEAQRTIDKALDIKEENSMSTTVSDEFFDTWGVQEKKETLNTNAVEKHESSQDNVSHSSLWGSFTGSFFDHGKEYNKSISVDSLDDTLDGKGESFSQCKLVVQNSEEVEGSEDQEDELLGMINNLKNESENIVNEDELSRLRINEKIESNCHKDLNDTQLIPSQPDKIASVEPINKNLTLQNAFLETAIPNILTPPDKFQESVIDVAPSRNNNSLLDLSYDAIDTQPLSSKHVLPMTQAIPNLIDFPSKISITEAFLEEGFQSDKTLKASDNTMESSSDTSTLESSSNSTYVKNLIADAMNEKNNVVDTEDTLVDRTCREQSPISSESRSDLVKIGSDVTSGHTSADELETTTSSDIEIISSPTGDSSSTQSRQSPAKQHKGEFKDEDNLCKIAIKKHVKGHNRELSEASSIVSDDCQFQEVERLLKRIAEMSEILDVRESKLIEINRRNVDLQEINNDLKSKLDAAKGTQSSDLLQVTEDYTQRMSSLEKKFQKAIMEKDALKKELDQMKLDGESKLSKDELAVIVSEKDDLITQLRLEGEKLSKQHLTHSNIIKKLRAKEKENESTIKHLKGKIEELSLESERLQRSLTAKEEVEKTQIEAVHQLTAKNKKLETEMANLQSQLDDMQQKYSTTKKSLNAAREELNDKIKIAYQLSAKEQLLESLENEKKVAESQNEEVINQLTYLRTKLHEYENGYIEKEHSLRYENSELLRRLENAETRNEELSQSVLEISQPLLQQLESVQANYKAKMANFEKIEGDLNSKINDLQSKIHSISSSERSFKEECLHLRSKLADLETQLNSTKNQNEMLSMQVERAMAEKDLTEQEMQRKMIDIHNELEEKNAKIKDFETEISYLKQSGFEKVPKLGELNQECDVNVDANAVAVGLNSRSISPTNSVGKVSVAESLGSSVWSQYESFDIGQAPRYTNMFEIQMLQSNLQQKEGEVQQLQWELNRREQERSLLNVEISTLHTKVEELNKKYEKNKEQFNDLRQECDVLCQLYGEKVEENEELKLDLLEIKDVYKGQIDELVRQVKENNIS